MSPVGLKIFGTGGLLRSDPVQSEHRLVALVLNSPSCQAPMNLYSFILICSFHLQPFSFLLMVPKSGSSPRTMVFLFHFEASDLFCLSKITVVI